MLDADCIINNTYPTKVNPVGIYEKYIPEENKLKFTITTSYNQEIIKQKDYSSNIQYHPPVLNQGKQNGCVAFTIASMIEYYQKRNLHHTPLSAEALYYWTRKVENTINENSGTNPKNAFQIAFDIGVPREIYHENSQQNQFVEPSDQCFNDAYINKIDGWKELFNWNNRNDPNINKSNIIIEQLRNGDVVGISVLMSNSLYHPKKTELLISVKMKNLLKEWDINLWS